LGVPALKNGETPKKMTIRVKYIGITTALIGRAIWRPGIFLNTAVG
jgi:hypothetical protein